MSFYQMEDESGKISCHSKQERIIIIVIADSMVHCQISNIRHTKSQNLNASHLVLQVSFPNPLKPGVQSEMKM